MLGCNNRMTPASGSAARSHRNPTSYRSRLRRDPQRPRAPIERGDQRGRARGCLRRSGSRPLCCLLEPSDNIDGIAGGQPFLGSRDYLAGVDPIVAWTPSSGSASRISTAARQEGSPSCADRSMQSSQFHRRAHETAPSDKRSASALWPRFGVAPKKSASPEHLVLQGMEILHRGHRGVRNRYQIASVRWSGQVFTPRRRLLPSVALNSSCTD
jgi:hypothetical protein